MDTRPYRIRLASGGAPVIGYLETSGNAFSYGVCRLGACLRPVVIAPGDYVARRVLAERGATNRPEVSSLVRALRFEAADPATHRDLEVLQSENDDLVSFPNLTGGRFIDLGLA